MRITHVTDSYVASRLEDGRRNVKLHRITAFVNEREIARIVWHDSNGEIEKLWVAPEHRRKGIATTLWSIAQWLDPKPQHSAWRTDDGDAWARSLTDQLPERKSA